MMRCPNRSNAKFCTHTVYFEVHLSSKIPDHQILWLRFWNLSTRSFVVVPIQVGGLADRSDSIHISDAPNVNILWLHSLTHLGWLLICQDLDLTHSIANLAGSAHNVCNANSGLCGLQTNIQDPR